MKPTYDSTQDTQQHIARVQEILRDAANELEARATIHDASKLEEPEKSGFDEFTPKLKNSTYGSTEYAGFLNELSVVLGHHYAHNRHHPEHFENGVDGMDIFDILEMICDWKAATERHADGSLETSIQINKKRFELSDQLAQIFENTRQNLNWK